MNFPTFNQLVKQPKTAYSIIFIIAISILYIDARSYNKMINSNCEKEKKELKEDFKKYIELRDKREERLIKIITIKETLDKLNNKND